MLKRKGTRFTSLLLVFALVLSLLPPLTAHADTARIDINSLYVSTTQPTGADESRIPRLTTNPIKLTAYINNISDAQVPNLYYEVYNVNTGSLVVEKMNKAQVSGNLITFSNVYLTEGLNRVTIKIGETSVISSAPGWAYFTPVTNIANLLINNVPFEDGQTYPANMTPNSSDTSLTFTGKAYNATEVQAVLAGDPVPKSNYFVNGDFVLTADHVSKRNSSLAIMFMNAGDNRITFMAKNNSNTYSLTRKFVYDNGKPYAYQAKISHDPDGTGASGDQTDDLIEQPSVIDNTVTLSALVKIPLVKFSESDPTPSLQYPVVNIKAGDGAYNEYDLSALTGTEPIHLVEHVDEKYNVYQFSTVTTLDDSSKTKFLEFIFSNPVITSLEEVTSTYSFSYTNTSLPYIHSVYMGLTNEYAGTKLDPGLRLNETEPNTINELPKKLRIFTDNGAADSINIYIDGASTPSANVLPVPAANTEEFFDTDPNTNLFTYELDNLANGNHTVAFHPVSGGVENLAGVKSYSFTVTSAPYVIIDNFYNGQIIRGTKTTSCGNTADCISGRLVNVPQSEIENVEVTVNDGVIMKFDKTTDFKVDRDGDGTITPEEEAGNISLGKFKFRYKGVNSRTAELQPGRNTIKIYIYNQGKLITLASYEIFIYETDAPDFIGKISPGPVEPSERELFLPAKQTDSYSTNEPKVVFRGSFQDATSLKITARSKDTNGIPISKAYEMNVKTKDITFIENTDKTGTFDDASFFQSTSIAEKSNKVYDFTTRGIKLNPKGDTIFEFEITNASNIKVIRTVLISREPLPYKFIDLADMITKNDKNEDQITINSNFLLIRLEAEYADKVIFDKKEASKETGSSYIFRYEARNLKAGKNTLKFTVYRGTQVTNGSIILYNIDTPVEGASFKMKMNSAMKAFDGLVQLKFPKDTTLMRNEETDDHQYLTTDRNFLFGIANQTDGRVDKTETSNNTAVTLLKEPTLRFKPASKLFWIDSGTISPTEYSTDLEGALEGSGRMPYEGAAFYSRNPDDLVVPTQRGTLTLKYDPNIRDNAWKYLTVYHFGYYENKNGQVGPIWKNIGGVVDPGTNTITVPFETPGYYQVMYMAKSFQDITNHPWAREDLDTLYSKGIMDPKSSSSFVPNDFVTRGEFTTLLVRMFDIPLNYEGGLTFEDVGLMKMDKLADYKCIETAARAGIVRGITETQFMPNMSISRQDAAVMIARAAELKLGNDTAKSLVNLQKLFTDANSIDLYARTAVEAIAKAGLIEGKENILLQGQTKATIRFDPLESFTRAEVATVAIRVLKQQKKIPK